MPTHDQSILLAKNLNPKTSKETLQDFVESTKNADVFNVVLGKDGKAIVILKDEIGGYTYASVFDNSFLHVIFHGKLSVGFLDALSIGLVFLLL